MTALEVFSYYRKLGYKVIPLYKNTKVPIFKNWYSVYNPDFIENFISKCVDEINFGIILGDVIDIEGDCIESNEEIDNMLKGIPHPIFTSSKSKHHLFRSTVKNLTRVVVDGIEYRGNKHQSVIPPSKHEAGIKYEWKSDICELDNLPYLPKFLDDKIKSALPTKKKSFKKRRLCKPNHVEAFCLRCRRKYFLHEIKFYKELEHLRKQNSGWTCKSCIKLPS